MELSSARPPIFWTHLNAHILHVFQTAHREPDGLAKDKIDVVHRAILDACDPEDGVQDGVVENPRACRIDFEALRCRPARRTECLTDSELAIVRTIYADSTNSRTHERVYPDLAPGSEPGWNEQLMSVNGISLSYFRDIVFARHDWTVDNFDLDRDVVAVDTIDNGLINATNPDLTAFFQGGGKLLQYHGWADPQISPYNSIDYYEGVRGANKMTLPLEASYRLFMVPGMDHCGGGLGPDDIAGQSADPLVAALEQWIERGQPPQAIVVSKRFANSSRTRPLCAYPLVAHYSRSGNTDDAANFTCADR